MAYSFKCQWEFYIYIYILLHLDENMFIGCIVKTPFCFNTTINVNGMVLMRSTTRGAIQCLA